jgi:hypothetical protein
MKACPLLPNGMLMAMPMPVIFMAIPVLVVVSMMALALALALNMTLTEARDGSVDGSVDDIDDNIDDDIDDEDGVGNNADVFPAASPQTIYLGANPVDNHKVSLDAMCLKD